MAAKLSDIIRWIEVGKDTEATHVIVVCDKFDMKDYPVYVMPDDNVLKVSEKYSKKSMQKIMEVYNLNMDTEAQLKEFRAFHY